MLKTEGQKIETELLAEKPQKRNQNSRQSWVSLIGLRTTRPRGKSFIATNSYHPFWTNDRKSTKYTYFTCRQLCLAVNFLIDNIYVRFGNSVFRQVIGIPMGTNSAPLLSDLFLHTFEYDFMLKTMKAEMSKAVEFSTTFRYIDVLLSVNNDNFGNSISEIYPSGGAETQGYYPQFNRGVLPGHKDRSWRQQRTFSHQRV